LSGYYAGAAGGVGRSQVPALSAADQDGGCGVVGEEEWAGVLSVLGGLDVLM
jgi:hypothetical protein